MEDSLKNKNYIESFLGRVLGINEVECLIKVLNLKMEENIISLDFKITPALIVLSYKKDNYFLKELYFFIEDNDLELFETLKSSYDELKDSEEYLSFNYELTPLDFVFSELQYEQCCIMTEKRVKDTFSRKDVEDIVTKDVDLFHSSFDQTIDDTYSRTYLLEELIKKTKKL